MRARSESSSFIFYWASLALFGIFIARLIRVVVPVYIFNHAWHLKFSAALQELGIIALLGVIVLILAGLLDADNFILKGRILAMRRVAFAAAIGFLLLIPLVVWSGLKILQEANQSSFNQLTAINQSIQSIREASNEAALRSAYATLPNGFPPLPSKLEAPLQPFRARLVGQLAPIAKAFENRVDERLSNNWQEWIVSTIGSVLLLFFYAVGFAAVGAGWVIKQSPLERMIKSSSRRSKRVSKN